MSAELGLFKAVWPLMLLFALTIWMVWPNLALKRNRHPTPDNPDAINAPRNAFGWGDDVGGGDD